MPRFAVLQLLVQGLELPCRARYRPTACAGSFLVVIEARSQVGERLQVVGEELEDAEARGLHLLGLVPLLVSSSEQLIGRDGAGGQAPGFSREMRSPFAWPAVDVDLASSSSSTSSSEIIIVGDHVVVLGRDHRPLPDRALPDASQTRALGQRPFLGGEAGDVSRSLRYLAQKGTASKGSPCGPSQTRPQSRFQ